MSVNEPFVQGKAHELKQIAPMLKGCFAQVFLLIGAYEVDPLGLTFSEICELTGLSKPSVSAALKFLSRNNLITGQSEEGAVRYRACFGFYYRSEKVNLRDADEVKNFFLPNNCTGEIESNSAEERTTIISDAKTLLAAAGVFGSPLEYLAKVVPADVAREWSRWANRQREKDAEYGWGGIVVKALRSDPHALPPGAKTPKPTRRFRIAGPHAPQGIDHEHHPESEP